MLSYFTSPEEPRRTRWLLLCFIPLLLLYYVAAKGNGETKNHDVYANDQKVYLNTASKIADDPKGYFTPRQRTPGYAYLLSLFYSKDKFDQPDGTKPPFDLAWFERGKSINLHLSILLLAGLFLFCRRCLPLVESGLITVASGLLLFTFKAYYVQPEISYWVLSTMLFVLLGRMLLQPSWNLAVVCGLLSVVTFFVKAGTQPLLFLFAVTWVIKLLWDRFVRGDRESVLARVAQGALVLVIFVTLLVPYFIGTNKRFGKPMYSVYTEYMMWLPMDEEGSYLADRDYMWAFYYAGARSKVINVDEFNVALERAVRSRVKKETKKLKPTPEKLAALVADEFEPVTELPGRENFFARYPIFEHGVPRVGYGLKAMNKRVNKYYDRAMEMLYFVLKVALAGLVIRFAMWLRARAFPDWGFVVRDLSPPDAMSVRKLFAQRPYLLFYLLGFFCGYLVLYAWYDALAIGPRLVLSLYLPALVVAVMAVKFLFCGLEVRIPGKGQSLNLGKVANALLVVMLVYLSVRLMTGELYEHLNTGG